MLGLVVLVAAVLLLLSLITYNPADPSLNTVGGGAGLRPAHNWTGLAGAYTSDILLQILGVAVLLAPVVLGRVGIAWLRSRPVGSTVLRAGGLLLWLVFAPAAIALLPGQFLWHGAIPVSGVEGRVLADLMIEFVNLPGAVVISALMVALSLYLTTSFLLATAPEWFAEHFGLFRRMRERYLAWKERRAARSERRVAMVKADEDASYLSRRERIAARERAAQEAAALKPAREPGNSLLAGLFGWFGRRKRANLAPEVEAAQAAAPENVSVWQNIPRTVVDAPQASGLATAAAAAAPYAAQLAAAAAPLRATSADAEAAFADARKEARSEDDNWLDAPERKSPAPLLSRNSLVDLSMPEPAPARIPAGRQRLVVAPEAPPMPSSPQRASSPGTPISPVADIAAQNIAFGRRADADVRAIALPPKSVRGYKLPSSSLLFRDAVQTMVREDALRAEARLLVEKCEEFGVNGNVEQINPGPVVTTFEFRPDAGVKYSRVTGLADDLCLAMAAESILIERMPGKSTVGIQVPNSERETIWLRDVVECESFVQSKSKLPIALGKDINGRIVTADLAAMPHVLIAGSTGSGKSVAINAMIMSVLFKSTPEQVRMILVDPKRVELGMYEGIPHLFTPIITEAKLAANALRNAVKEMERRLKLLAANHVRNIDQFNKLFENGSEYLFEDVNQEPLPYIMIIIDELADLMMLDRANVEEAITRLAQMARAVGIHLVLATQRPSVDVITGLLKANVPTRMSFRLATKVDSRTIIDSNGAESLLGRGDMLFLPPGTSRLQRVHAPFVTEKEINAVTKFWKEQGTAEYVEGFLEGPKDEKGDSLGSANDGEEADPMFDDAVRLVFEFGKASTSLLQRRLRIGYGRAAHLIDMMERDGLVGPADGSKPRELLKSPSYFSEVDAAIR
jgi:S-DNA-T family DNA segregation ATPase FtsK/SpoIIIE